MTEGVTWAAANAIFESGDVVERPVHPKEPISIRLSSDIISYGGWLQVRSPYPVRPVIYDASGRLVKTLETIQGYSEPVRIPLEVSDLPRGVYWITSSGKESVVSERFVPVR